MDRPGEDKAQPGGRDTRRGWGWFGAGEPQPGQARGWGAGCRVLVADTWVLLRSQRCVSANQPGPLAHWSMATSRSSMSTRTTPLRRRMGSAPGAAQGVPVPTLCPPPSVAVPHRCHRGGWCRCMGWWTTGGVSSVPGRPARDVPPRSHGWGRGSSSWVRILPLKRGFNATDWGIGAAGVAAACRPLPCGTNRLPWVLRRGQGFPLGNGATSPL